MVNKWRLLAELPTQTDPKRPNSCLLIIASNEHKRPNNLSNFAVCFSHTLVSDIFPVIFISLHPQLPSSPPQHISSMGVSCPLCLRWIGFQLLSRAWRRLPPGFCHLSEPHCHFHSSSPTLPFYPPPPPPWSLPLSLTGQGCEGV